MAYSKEAMDRMILERMKFCSLFDSEMLQVTRWARIINGETRFGVYNGPGTLHITYFATWNGADWSTFMMHSLDMPVYAYAGTSLSLNHSFFPTEENLIREYISNKQERSPRDSFLQ